MTLDPNAPLVRSSDTIATEVDGEIVLIGMESGKYFGLDAVASEIWRRLAEPKSANALCAELKAHFEGDPATIEQETLAFLDRLSKQKLVAPA